MAYKNYRFTFSYVIFTAGLTPQPPSCKSKKEEYAPALNTSSLEMTNIESIGQCQ